MKFLDCFCGLGGVSEGFAKEGFECLGIEINPKIAKKYPYDVVIADVRTLNGENFRGFDVIWGSPPCRDFSTMTQANKGYVNREPPNPQKGLTLINCFLRFVEDAQPKIWLMENVSNLEKHFNLKPILRFLVSIRGYRTLWGNLNFRGLMNDFHFNINMEYDYTKYQYSMRSALRSKIPFAWSQAFAKACKEKLLES